MRALALTLACAVVACASSSSTPPPPAETEAGACPSDLPAACPSPTPSYGGQVAGIFDARCRSCHASGGVAASKDFTTYDAVFRLRSSILNQVYGCVMPPQNAAALTPEERAILLGWLVCKAPNN